jgi:signal transduction histidine kinase
MKVAIKPTLALVAGIGLVAALEASVPLVVWPMEWPIGRTDADAAPLGDFSGETVFASLATPRVGSQGASEALVRSPLPPTLPSTLPATSTLITLLLACCICGGLVFATAAYGIGHPLAAMVSAIRSGAADRAPLPLPLRRRDEIGALARELEGLLRRLSELGDLGASDLEEADRLATIGKLAAGVAHDLGTPLNVIGGHAGMIASGELSVDEAKASAQVIAAQTVRMTEMVRRILGLARQKRGVREDVDLAHLARVAVTHVEPLTHKRGVVVSIESPSAPVRAHGDAAQLLQALLQLIIDGAEAVGAEGLGGALRLSFTRSWEGDGHERAETVREMVAVHVESRSNVTSPPVPSTSALAPTTAGRPTRPPGAALGRTVCRQVARAHGGFVRSREESGDRPCFSIHLPVSASS